MVWKGAFLGIDRDPQLDIGPFRTLKMFKSSASRKSAMASARDQPVWIEPKIQTKQQKAPPCSVEVILEASSFMEMRTVELKKPPSINCSVAAKTRGSRGAVEFSKSRIARLDARISSRLSDRTFIYVPSYARAGARVHGYIGGNNK